MRTAWRRAAFRERELDYLLAEEKEERGERRGLEERAAGLMAALLIAFPISASVARDADTRDAVQVVALVLLAIVLVVALVQAGSLARALGAPKRKPNVVRAGRQRVSKAIGRGDFARAADEQRSIVATMRSDNAQLVREVRRVTGHLASTLAGLLIALALLVAAGHGPRRGPPGPPGRDGSIGPAAPAGQAGGANPLVRTSRGAG